jgi:hypothetical protein
VTISKGGYKCAEVSGINSDGNAWRMWWSWIDKSAHIESDKFMDNHAFMPLHSSAQLEVTILRIMCTIIIQYPNSELHMPV